MKWFKHDSNANTDAKLRKVRIKYGMEGYGLYWYCLELIAGTVEKHNITFELEHDSEVIAFDTGINAERVQEMMTYMVNLELFEIESNRIFCQKMATRTDEYTAKLLRNIANSPDKLRTISVPTPDKVPPIRREEKRVEKKRVVDSSEQASCAEPVFQMPLNNNTEFPIHESDIEEWKELYPVVDVIQELRKMRGWCNSNPKKRKTKSGVMKFMNSWLSKEQDKGGAGGYGKSQQESSSRIGAFPAL